VACKKKNLDWVVWFCLLCVAWLSLWALSSHLCLTIQWPCVCGLCQIQSWVD
jgi:hypothetical protein